MNTTIFVPVLTSDAQWIFCNIEEAFMKLGLLNAEGKILTGFQSAEEAIASYKERQPQEPFALLHLSIARSFVGHLCADDRLAVGDADSAGRKPWKLNLDGCRFIYQHKAYSLLMEIVPVERTGICLY